MTDFVLEQKRPIPSADLHEADYYYQEYEVLEKINKYANFLKQPLKLEMFVPCVDNEPFNYSKHGNKKEFEQAKEKVLFEGVELINDELINNGVLFWVGKFEGNENIENCISSNLTLTESAIKQIGL